MLRFFSACTGTFRLPEPASPPLSRSAAVYESVRAVTKSPAVFATARYVAMLAAIDKIASARKPTRIRSQNTLSSVGAVDERAEA